MKNREPLSYRLCIGLIYAVLTVFLFSTIAVFLHIFSVSFSSGALADTNQISIFPRGFTWAAMAEAVKDRYLIGSLTTSVIRLVLGVALNMTLMILTAYPMSKDKSVFPVRNVCMMLVVFTMMFNGGLVPNYLLVKNMGLMDSIWALVLPTALPVYLCVILMNFFRNIPKEIDEAAAIDGASHFRRLMVIVIPLAMPALATVATFASINHWNAWFDGIIYMRRAANYPYSSYLRYMIERLNDIQQPEEFEIIYVTGVRPLKMCYVLVSVLPVFVLYPFLQKYVKSGLTVGSVKG